MDVASGDEELAPAGRGLPRWIEGPAAALALVLSLPLLLVLAPLVRSSSSGPILFRQERMGRGGRPFVMLKLRSMRVCSGPAVTASDDRRTTGLGRLLRRFKLDELPQLWNIVRGDMSLVGPRPEVAKFVDLEDPRWRRVLSVRPGLTDPTTLLLGDEDRLLAAVEGSRERFYSEHLLPWKLARSASYLKSRTPWTDLEILLATLARLLRPGRPLPPELEELLERSSTPADL
jgi:lipopolysaccharide/colanic/teichoic acid biosynthesis glycosyltransferase